MVLVRQKFFFTLTGSSRIEDIPYVDFHIHTKFTDGNTNLDGFVERALQCGLEAIAFTDHVRKTSTYLKDYSYEIEILRKQCKIPIYLGVETKMINLKGDIDIPRGASSILDLIIGVLHRYPSDHDYDFISTSDLSPTEAAKLETIATINMIKQKKIDVVGHPTRIFCERYGQPFPADMLKKIVIAAKKNGVAIEINSRTPHLKDLLRICMEKNALLSLGSDAHSAFEIGNAHRILKSLLPTFDS